MNQTHHEAVVLADAGGIVRDLAAVIVENRAWLSEIDGAIGDGDHGINMAKGFTAAAAALGEPPPPLPDALDILGNTLLVDIGGSTGPLYGSFFLDMAEAMRASPLLDAAAFARALHAGLAAVQSIGEARPGDKTLLDALVPAIAAYDEACARGDGFAAAIDALVTAAAQGRDATRGMIARVGRASRLGERSRGVLDAGAASCCLLLQALAAGLRARLARG